MERTDLITHLQEYFNNRTLIYQLTINATDEEEKVVGEKPLTRKEQYFKIIEEYPLVKDLKEKA